MTVLPVRCTSRGGIPSLSSAARACAVGGKVNRGQPGGQHPVHLFGERLIAVTGAETGFDVTRGNSLEVGGEGGREAGHGVALHQQDVGADLAQQRRQPLQHSRGDVRRAIDRRSSGRDRDRPCRPKTCEHLIEHGAMLGRHADHALEPIGRVLKRLDHRRHLDRLRAGPEDAENPDHRLGA